MRVVIITENRYPCEDAGGIRQHATAKVLEELGYSVVVLGYGTSTNKKMLRYDGIDYVSFRSSSDNLLIRILYRITASLRMQVFFRRKCKDARIILLADVSEHTFRWVFRLNKNGERILVHDSVEWFSAEQFANGDRAIAYRERDNINRKHVGNGWRVMAISSYLEEHFSSRCDKTVRIPVIMDINSIEGRTDDITENEKITFAYVGSPGKKDYLKSIIEGFELLPVEHLAKVKLNIVGVDEQQLLSMCGINEASLKKLTGVLTAHGRMPHSQAVDFVRRADYTVLFRDSDLRYAKAGFPTKIVESLACGTPPICNISSDLGMYLEDGYNSVIANGHSPGDVKAAIESAINISPEKKAKMRQAARKTAETHFDYRVYVDRMSELLR